MHSTVNSKFDTFLKNLADSLQIPDSLYERAEERYKSISNWLNREKSTIKKYDPVIYSQGSFRNGLVIKPFSGADEYDLDLVCTVNLTKRQVTQKDLKELVGEEITGYAKANNMTDKPRDGRRCWCLNYQDEVKFHMDLLPALPDGTQFQLLLEKKGYSNPYAKDAIAITDKTSIYYYGFSDNWPHCNPYGFAEWFKSRMQVRYKEVLAELKKGYVERIPEHKIKTPLQMVIQILKHHRNIMFANDPETKPASIIVKTLAALGYNNESNLSDALFNILNSMRGFITQRHNKETGTYEYVILNPVNPLENFAERWKENPQKITSFFNWLDQVTKDFTKARETDDYDRIAELLEPGFGSQIIKESLRKSFSNSGLITLSKPTTLTRFNVPHRQKPLWPLNLIKNVTLRAFSTYQGIRRREITNGEAPLAKNVSLLFKAETNVLEPYLVKWQVVNTGAEASHNLRGGFYESNSGQLQRTEATQYRGLHWVECFIIKDGVCVARSGEFVIKII